MGADRSAEIESHLQQLASRGMARVVETSDVTVHPSTGERHVVAVLEVVAASAGGPGW